MILLFFVLLLLPKRFPIPCWTLAAFPPGRTKGENSRGTMEAAGFGLNPIETLGRVVGDIWVMVGVWYLWLLSCSNSSAPCVT